MKKLLRYIILFLLCLTFFIFFKHTSIISESVKQAITVCVNVLIPSMLPCIVISNILIHTEIISLLPSKIRFLGLFIISLISGYPVGSILLNESVQKNIISSTTAKKLLPCFINAGPTFVINVVGISVLNNKEIGVIIFLSQCFASLILFVFCKGFLITCNLSYNIINFSDAVINAFTASIVSLKNICLYVIIFFPLNKTLEIVLGKYSVFITSITEITSSILSQKNIYLIVLLLSFGGICIYLQIKSIVKFNFSTYYVVSLRLIHGIISLFLTKTFLQIFKIKLTVFSNINTEVLYKIPNNFSYCILIVFTIVCLIVSINRKSSGKLLKDLL